MFERIHEERAKECGGERRHTRVWWGLTGRPGKGQKAGSRKAAKNRDAVFRQLSEEQKDKARARQIEKFLDWTRGSEISNYDDQVPAFDKIESISSKYRSPEDRAQDIEKVMNWLRRKGKKDTTGKISARAQTENKMKKEGNKNVRK